MPRMLGEFLGVFLLLALVTGCQRGEFDALTYNVAGLPQGVSASNPDALMPLIGPLLNDYDVVLLQETFRTPQPNPLAPLRLYHEVLEAASRHPFRSVPKPSPFGSDPNRPTAILSDGLNRFSNFPFDPVMRIQWTGCFGELGGPGDGDCLGQKGFSVARTYVAPGVSIDIYNLHGEAGGGPPDQRLRSDNMVELGAAILAYSAGRAVIVGGDFNLHTDRPLDSAQFQTLLDATGLIDACDYLSCTEQVGSIDKFLFRSGSEVVVVPRSFHFEVETFVGPQGEPLSDHDPLHVRFAWFAPLAKH
jgi:hypothetical protein